MWEAIKTWIPTSSAGETAPSSQIPITPTPQSALGTETINADSSVISDGQAEKQQRKGKRARRKANRRDRQQGQREQEEREQNERQQRKLDQKEQEEKNRKEKEEKQMRRDRREQEQNEKDQNERKQKRSNKQRDRGHANEGRGSEKSTHRDDLTQPAIEKSHDTEQEVADAHSKERLPEASEQSEINAIDSESRARSLTIDEADNVEKPHEEHDNPKARNSKSESAINQKSSLTVREPEPHDRNATITKLSAPIMNRRPSKEATEPSSLRLIDHSGQEFRQDLLYLREEDLSDGFRAITFSMVSHRSLSDLLWQIVIFADYFHDSDGSQAELPQHSRLTLSEQGSPGGEQSDGSEPSSSHRAAVEEAVRNFLSRTDRTSAENRNEFVFANRDMALLLHQALQEKRSVSQKELYGMAKRAYGSRVNFTGLRALFS